MTEKLLDNDLVAIHKSRVSLTLNKPAYVGMCILNLSKRMRENVIVAKIKSVKQIEMLL